ncbi:MULTISPECIES: hypothetical protein [Modicisalibacter]|uniref:hypothetical protein n=1 Tax=Modicisalibacter TaxID=574347 RepID=UPI00079895C4|nr:MULTISPECIES: hypothetical protein [Halomonadaceae]KXS37673.1 MAG: hypothetical protein AWU55_2180 [Halomonadaceae bacterium T82-2]MBZ9557351.1 hypothetical protein [Modicisalibacter sp. R2A 31.J]MBZ9573983.1 hypothetical protein [Modicisalibacter sp. MOD 31.J]
MAGNCVFPLLVHGERCIKRVQRVASVAWLLISDNPRYDQAAGYEGRGDPGAV